MKEETPSGTAALIAAAIVLLHADPRRSYLVSGRSAVLATRVLELCFANSWLGPPRLRSPWFRAVARILERLTIPGIVSHYALRKRQISELANQIVNEGASQGVILGAGFDSLAFELMERSKELRLWELDHPATQRCKIQALTSLQWTGPRLVPADLSIADPAQVLTSMEGFKPGEKILWIAEGLLMYFNKPTVSRIFERAASISGAGSKFVFTFMRPDNRGRLRFVNQTKPVDWWLKRRGEMFRWGATPELLSEAIQPWQVLQILDENAGLQQANVSPARGEMICLAELASKS